MMHKSMKMASWMMAAPMMMAAHIAKKSMMQGSSKAGRTSSSHKDAWTPTSCGPSPSAKCDTRAGKGRSPRKLDIVDSASSLDELETLVQAVVQADLVDVLRGDGPFTVFAPTNEAFAALPEGQLEELLGDKKQLSEILLFHVVPARIGSKELAGIETLRTASGKTLAVNSDDGVKIGDRRVLKADIACANGIVHLIDGVLLP